jgi:hypothetical protein
MFLLRVLRRPADAFSTDLQFSLRASRERLEEGAELAV